MIHAIERDPPVASAHASVENRTPDCAGGASTTAKWFAHMLDHVDYGMLLVTDESHVVHANRAALEALGNPEHPLCIVGSELHVRSPAHHAPLRQALVASTKRGLRTLLTLGTAEPRTSIAVVPLPRLSEQGPDATVLLLGKRAVCEELSAQWYARVHGLTSAETEVLRQLYAGDRPNEIARQHGVAVSTIRTQICSIRAKTGAQTIRALIHQVAVLPPLVSALRSRVAASGDGFDLHAVMAL